ncbi:MAG: phage integrase SAM-like domain-containing protein [bacterium]
MKKNISFYIAKNREDKRGFVPIYGQVTIKSKNYPFQVEKIKPRYWNPGKQRVNKNRENEPDNGHKEINDFLKRISKNAERFDRFNNYQEPPPRNEVKKIFFQIAENVKSFNDAYDEFIESNKGKVSFNTTRSRKTAKNYIEGYQKHYGIELQFSDINLEFFDNLYKYTFETEKSEDETELENNTFATYLAKFKSFLEWANDKGYYSGLEHRKYSFSEKEKSVVCLTPDEFKTLYNYDFENERLRKTRDLYCFGCLTGLRYSDVQSLRYEHFQDGYIVKNITKTKEIDRIPILPQAQVIIDRYNTGSIYPLPRLSNVKMNKYIKECCDKADIDAPTVKYRYRGNQITETVHPKHELITYHTARKTFITLAYIKGLDTKIIKSITGHKNDSTFDKYLKIADEMKKEKMLQAMSDL